MKNSSSTTPCVNLWPVGFHAAALATVPFSHSVANAHPTSCACTPQFVPVSKMVNLAGVHQAPQLFSEHL